MTFSDTSVAALANEHFVAAWINRGEGFHNEDYSSEEWIFKEHYEAYPTRNICTFFMTPDLRVFHYVAGYASPAVFAAEIETAITLRRQAFDDDLVLKPLGMDRFRRLHGDAAAAVASRPRDERPAPRYRGFTHVHSAACARAAQDGDRYLKELHQWWAQAKELPDFQAVRFDYLYGNSFSEESRATTRLKGRCIVHPD